MASTTFVTSDGDEHPRRPVLYIAYSGSAEHGYKLGDTVVAVLTAHHMVTEYLTQHPDASVFISVVSSDVYIRLWENWKEFHWHSEKVYFIHDSSAKSPEENYRRFDKRRRLKNICGIQFDDYKEIFRRVDVHRGVHLAGTGREEGLGRKNIVEYILYSQPEPTVVGYTGFPFLFQNKVGEYYQKFIISPRAYSQGNSVFTFDWYKKLTLRLATELQDLNIPVIVNDSRADFHSLVTHPNINIAFPDISSLLRVFGQCYGALGPNTGTGWLKMATYQPPHARTPLWACDAVGHGIFDFSNQI